MFVVITNGVVSYAGPNQIDAIATLGSHPNSAMHSVESNTDIEKLLKPKDCFVPEGGFGFSEGWQKQVEKPVEFCGTKEAKPTTLFDDALKMMEFTASASETLKKAVNQLNELGVNEKLVDNVVTKANSLVGEVRSLGIKGMKTVGESFIDIGNLLKSVDDKK